MKSLLFIRRRLYSSLSNLQTACGSVKRVHVNSKNHRGKLVNYKTKLHSSKFIILDPIVLKVNSSWRPCEEPGLVRTLDENLEYTCDGRETLAFSCAGANLRASDGHCSRTSFHLLRWLYQHAQRTAASRDEIVQERAVDAFLLANLGTDLRHKKDVHWCDQGGQSAQQTAISNRLSVLASRVAMTKVGHQTCAAVVETSKQSMRPLSCHSRTNI